MPGAELDRRCLRTLESSRRGDIRNNDTHRYETTTLAQQPKRVALNKILAGGLTLMLVHGASPASACLVYSTVSIQQGGTGVLPLMVTISSMVCLFQR